MEGGRRRKREGEVEGERQRKRGRQGRWKEGEWKSTGRGEGWGRNGENSQETGLKSNEERPLLLSAIKAITGLR